MDCKDKIAYIILGYLNGEYEINDFCDLFEEYYEEFDEEELPESSRDWNKYPKNKSYKKQTIRIYKTKK